MEQFKQLVVPELIIKMSAGSVILMELYSRMMLTSVSSPTGDEEEAEVVSLKIPTWGLKLYPRALTGHTGGRQLAQLSAATQSQHGPKHQRFHKRQN